MDTETLEVASTVSRYQQRMQVILVVSQPTLALPARQVEEFYVLTWDSAKEQIFEMPTGGAAIMRKGANLLKLARKEQCLALVGQLRTKFKTDACFYRVFPSGEVEYLHPKDGVYPEKVNAGREGVNQNFRRIGENCNPIKVRVARVQVLAGVKDARRG